MRFLLITLLVWPNIAAAQNYFCGKQFVTGAASGIEYPFTSSGVFNTNGAEYYFDFTQDPSSSPVTDGTGAYSFVVVGTPTRINDGTYPAGLSGTEGYAWSSHASNNGLSRADDNSLDLPTDWTYVVVFTSLGSGASFIDIKKKSTGPTNGFQIYGNGVNLMLGTHESGSDTYLQKSSLNIGRVSCGVIAFDGTGGTGSSTGTIFVDELASASSAIMNPPGNASASMLINSTGATNANNIRYTALYKDATWTEAQARSFCRKFYGLYADNGQDYMTTTSATPAATYLSDSGGPSTLVSTSANSAIIGAHGFYAHPAINNFVQRSSFESWPTWDEIETAGDGTSSIDQTADATAVHGLSHATFTLTGTTSSGTLQSACVTSGIAANLYVSAFLKKGSGTTETAIRIHEYSDASCTTSIGTTDIVAATDLTTSWVEHGGLFAAGSWNGSTAGWEIEIHETCDGGCDSHVDAVQAASRNVATDSYCVICDTDATCSCTANDAMIPQPLTPGAWKVSVTVRSRSASVDRGGAGEIGAGNVLESAGTVGNNNKVSLYFYGTSVFFYVYTGLGVIKQCSKVGVLSADTDYLLEAYHYSNGDIKVCVDGSCGSVVSGANMDAVSSTFRVGKYSDIWIRNLKVEAL